MGKKKWSQTFLEMFFEMQTPIQTISRRVINAIFAGRRMTKLKPTNF